MRILFITSNRIGDAVLSTGLLAHLVDAHPDARFTVACGPIAVPLFRAVPRLDRLIPLAKRSLARHWIRLWAECVGVRWDLVVDLRNSAVGRLVWSRRAAFHRRVPGVHKVTEIGAVLGLDPPPAPRLWIDEAARAAADRLLPTGVPFLAIGPTANWTGKEWPADRFAELARRLTAPQGPLAGARVAVLAAGSEVERARPVLAALGEAAIDLTGRTDPLAAAACLERAALYVGNDSGLMHIAAAVGTPTLGLFGPGYPEMYAPWGPRARAVTGTVPRDELLRRMEAGSQQGLMDGISVDAATIAAQEMLSTFAFWSDSCDEVGMRAGNPAAAGPSR
ncbi:glycosyltransferase family 9 protein [Azospirillum sp.]|uniref:glycosyltransferase family 9 protein n=1 Tax=Azospirillum sp. TaxID=34012 RepID=UPI002D4E722F|nr:glycosyltransferase family 9 protein [Azospirillum sp.]HYD68328.1 glycosyltransferase family 9 protein [Azospirillum sp.]